MASTSTNKQPLLVDHVFHQMVDLNTAAAAAIDVAGTNTALVVLDATTSDGAIVEDVYSIARGSTLHTINLYLSRSNDYLRPGEGLFIGSFDSATTIGEVTRWEEMPKILAPVPAVGAEAQLRALYVPKGMVLWAARQSDVPVTDGPILGAQGGWY